MTPRPTRLAVALFGLLACLTINSCQNPGSGSGSGSSVVDYTSPTSKMSKKDRENYAFDDSGHYRENWVASNAGGRAKPGSPTTMSTDSPYVQEGSSIEKSGYKTVPTSAAYADMPVSEPGPQKSIASSSSSSPSVSKKKSPPSTASSRSKSSGSRNSGNKSTASKSSGSKKSTPVASSKSKKPAGKPAAVVTVKSGDTLYSLSRRSGVPVEKIKSYNGMKSDLLVDGKTLKIPSKR